MGFDQSEHAQGPTYSYIIKLLVEPGYIVHGNSVFHKAHSCDEEKE